MEDNMLQLALLSLATWRLTALLVYDRGPRDIFVRLRDASDAIGGPLSCFGCVSGWVSLLASLPFWAGPGYQNGVVWWFAIWGLAFIMEEVRWAYFPPDDEECDAEAEDTDEP
jgi:hypothetical protein